MAKHRNARVGGESIGMFVAEADSPADGKFQHGEAVQTQIVASFVDDWTKEDVISNSMDFKQVKAVLAMDSRWQVVHESSRMITFVPKSWLDWLPSYGEDDEHPQSWIVFDLRDSEPRKRLELIFSVHAFDQKHRDKRQDIIESLIEKVPQLGFNPRNKVDIGRDTTRLCRIETVLKYSDAQKADTIRATVSRELDKLYDQLQSVPSILRPLLKSRRSV